MSEVPPVDPTKVQFVGCDGHYMPRSRGIIALVHSFSQQEMCVMQVVVIGCVEAQRLLCVGASTHLGFFF